MDDSFFSDIFALLGSFSVGFCLNFWLILDIILVQAKLLLNYSRWVTTKTLPSGGVFCCIILEPGGTWGRKFNGKTTWLVTQQMPVRIWSAPPGGDWVAMRR